MKKIMTGLIATMLSFTLFTTTASAAIKMSDSLRCGLKVAGEAGLGALGGYAVANTPGAIVGGVAGAMHAASEC